MNKSKINYLVDLKNILKSGKSSNQEFTKENKQLKQYTTNAKQQQYQRQQQYQKEKYTLCQRYKNCLRTTN